ncbi:hypothetical protein B296_00035330 [Ensete ventricosum]|uniref:Retrotransposon gag domain-containing protein n=1 Tax=Ensete ventricosum TaxID=4639 RepID=A0A426ZJB7_ENSVE|nr:hypothetical protein B296_00035330 [Ensete ventricosum]
MRPLCRTHDSGRERNRQTNNRTDTRVLTTKRRFQTESEILIPIDVGKFAYSAITRLDEVQRDFVKSKEEVGETSKGGFPFVLEIQDKPVPPSFWLPILEPYDRSIDPSEHVATFRAQMALYDTSDALMCHTFPTTHKGPARMWYSRLKSSSISSFDHLTREFELNFMASSRPRLTVASLLGLTQGSDEPLTQFVGRFATEVQRMLDTHPSLAIQAFLMGLRPSRFFWSLIEQLPSTVPKMLQQVSIWLPKCWWLESGRIIRGHETTNSRDNPREPPEEGIGQSYVLPGLFQPRSTQPE